MKIHLPKRRDTAQQPAITMAATSPTHAGAGANAHGGAAVHDDDTPPPREPASSEGAPLSALTHPDPQEPHFDIRGSAVGSSADDIIVNMRDDHIEVRVNVPDPRLLEGFDSHMFTHLMNMLGIVDIAHLSEVSHATNALTLKVPVVQAQRERWIQVQQQWATRRQETLAPVQSELAALHRRVFCSRLAHSIPMCMIFIGLASIAVGSWGLTQLCDPPQCGPSANSNPAIPGLGIALGSFVTIFCIACQCANRKARADNLEAYRTGQNDLSMAIEFVQQSFIRHGLPPMRQEPMPERFNEPTRRVSDDPGELPVATSVEHARQLQEQGYEVKFHAPEDAGDAS